MKNVVKIMCLAVTAALLPALAGCSGGGAPQGSAAESEPEAAAEAAEAAATVKGETFDGGNISMLVPEGWTAFNGADVFDEYEEGFNPNEVNIIKGATEASDILSNPYVLITYYENGSSYISPKSIYEDATDVDPISVGGREWTGFTTDNSGYPTAILAAEDGDSVVTAIILYENGDKKISLDDEDVLAILESVQINA